jgi:hypothetical protein
MNFASTQLRTESTVEFVLTHNRRTSDSQARRIPGVTSGGNLKSSDASAPAALAQNNTVAMHVVFIIRLTNLLTLIVRLRTDSSSQKMAGWFTATLVCWQNSFCKE